MLHSDLIEEFPCDGELVRVEERCTRWLIVERCRGCGTEFTYEPDSKRQCDILATIFMIANQFFNSAAALCNGDLKGTQEYGIANR